MNTNTVYNTYNRGMKSFEGCCSGAPPRCRAMIAPGVWRIRARVERYIEPAILLLLSEGSTYGYDLASSLSELLSVNDMVDQGNLYRLLRGLEAEGLVKSEWADSAPGPTKRVYALTEEGKQLLDGWVEALRGTYATIGRFLDRYDQNVQRKPRTLLGKDVGNETNNTADHESEQYRERRNA